MLVGKGAESVVLAPEPIDVSAFGGGELLKVVDDLAMADFSHGSVCGVGYGQEVAFVVHDLGKLLAGKGLALHIALLNRNEIAHQLLEALLQHGEGDV